MAYGIHGSRSEDTCASLLAGVPNGFPFGRMFAGLPGAKHDPKALSAWAAPRKVEDQPGPLEDAFPTVGDLDMGLVFLGQFIDHDITFMRGDPGLDTNDPEKDTPHFVPGDPGADPKATPVNCRDPRLSLDVVYGAGPDDEPSSILYENFYFRLADNGYDIRRDVQIESRTLGTDKNDKPIPDTRLIADPRNDENILILQVHVMFMRLHNVILKEVAKNPERPTREEFDQARRKVVDTYHHIVMFEYLLKVCEPNIVAAKAASRKTPLFSALQTSGGPTVLPIEFAAAAYRFQHSQVPDAVQMNIQADVRHLFDPQPGNDLRGGQTLGEQTKMDFSLFFTSAPDADGRGGGSNNNAQKAFRLDGKLSAPLFQLPMPVAIDAPPVSLAERNLRRGAAFRLPSGQSVAKHLAAQGFPEMKDGNGNPRVLTPEDVGIPAEFAAPASGDFEDLNESTPLWFYVIREAEILGNGDRLGPVGSSILAEVFIGLLLIDGSKAVVGDRKKLPAGAITSFGELVDYVIKKGG